ncbi:16912_t:CDS:1, partial [Dentiscutata erythropus]
VLKEKNTTLTGLVKHEFFNIENDLSVIIDLCCNMAFDLQDNR